MEEAMVVPVMPYFRSIRSLGAGALAKLIILWRST
jgi:hypothetical protein